MIDEKKTFVILIDMYAKYCLSFELKVQRRNMYVVLFDTFAKAFCLIQIGFYQ